MNRYLAMIGALAIALGLISNASLVVAHHSGTMYDRSKTMTIRGTVLELRWVNPHVSVLIKGIADGGKTEAEEWLMEMTSPINLVRVSGWSRNAVKAGDEVIVEFSPLRDTSLRGGALKKVTIVATGKVYTADIRAQEMPGLE
jgi:hypothetical protein